MISVNTLKLIDALFSGCTEEQKRSLVSLYKTAFSNSDGYKKTHYILENCEFYGTSGEDLKLQIKRVVDDSFDGAEGFRSMLTVLEHISLRAESELELTEDYIRSSRLDPVSLSVVEKSFANQSVEFYKVFINYLCCMCATFYGKDAFRKINIDLHTGALDVVKNVTDAVCQLNNEILERKKPAVWKITRQHFAGINLVEYDGFALSLVTDSPEAVLRGCRKIAPYMYTDDNAVCYGVGNITNLDFSNGASVLGAEIIEKPALNCLDRTDLDYACIDLMSIVNMLFQNKVCIIPPETMVEILNRYFMIKAAKHNKLAQRCIYCGKEGCTHFVLPTNFDEM